MNHNTIRRRRSVWPITATDPGLMAALAIIGTASEITELARMLGRIPS